jgi:hypothetical protein
MAVMAVAGLVTAAVTAVASLDRVSVLELRRVTTTTTMVPILAVISSSGYGLDVDGRCGRFKSVDLMTIFKVEKGHQVDARFHRSELFHAGAECCAFKCRNRLQNYLQDGGPLAAGGVRRRSEHHELHWALRARDRGFVRTVGSWHGPGALTGSRRVWFPGGSAVPATGRRAVLTQRRLHIIGNVWISNSLSPQTSLNVRISDYVEPYAAGPVSQSQPKRWGE